MIKKRKNVTRIGKESENQDLAIITLKVGVLHRNLILQVAMNTCTCEMKLFAHDYVSSCMLFGTSDASGHFIATLPLIWHSCSFCE